jgi:CTP synthase (UTP-ammonia lyase)
MSWYESICEGFSTTWFYISRSVLEIEAEKRRQEAPERQAIIAAMLNTAEGRDALGAAMVAPIRRALNYQSIGRKLLMVDELPQGSYARYEKEVI